MSKKGGKSAGGSAPRRPEDWTALERLRAVAEASGLSGDELGEFLRREGLHEEALAEWRQAALDALQPSAPNARSGDKKHIKRLERELLRKEKALAEAATLLVLKKKAQELWGDEDDDTSDETEQPSSGWSIKAPNKG
jgi:transposase-like protein